MHGVLTIVIVALAPLYAYAAPEPLDDAAALREHSNDEGDEGDTDWADYAYFRVKESAYCGVKKDANLLGTARDATQCAALVSGTGANSFVFGKGFARGKCYAGTIKVDEDQYTSWSQHRSEPDCPDERGWRESTLFDFYAMEPLEPHR